MRFSAVAASLLSVGVALAQTVHVVKVGGNGSLTYNPNQLTGVQNGDAIQFQFLEKNHTVTQSTFAAPCSNVTDANGVVTGVDSGFQFVQPNATQFPVWQITVNNASTPLWFFCRQATHCQSGMVFAVNPTAAKTYEAFAANAALSTSVDGSAAPSNGTTSAPASGASGAATSTAGAPAVSAGSAGSSGTGSATSTPGAPSVSTTSKPNGAGATRFTSGAALLSLAGLSFGLLL